MHNTMPFVHVFVEHPMALVTSPSADDNYNAATLPSAIPEIVNHTNKGTCVDIVYCY